MNNDFAKRWRAFRGVAEQGLRRPPPIIWRGAVRMRRVTPSLHRPLIAAMVGLVIFALPGSHRAFAANPRTLANFLHTGWTLEDGAPPGIRSLAQTPDGYLWVGSGKGLFRFDGVSFEPLVLAPGTRHPRNETITALLTTRDGALWIGYGFGGVAVYKNGQYRLLPGPPEMRTILSMVQDSDGTVWAAIGSSTVRIMRFRNDRWEALPGDGGLPDLFVQNLLATRDGAVWAAMQGAISRLPRGADRFLPVNAIAGRPPGLAQDTAGNVWIADDRGSRIFALENGEPIAGAQNYDAGKGALWSKAIFDRVGALWAVTFSTGVSRVYPGPGARAMGQGWAQEQEVRTGGLTSDITNAILEDREGNIWIATAAGLDRYRLRDVVPERAVEPESARGYVQLVDSAGAYWVSDMHTVFRALPGQPLLPVARNVEGVMALCEGPNREIWAANTERVVRILPGGEVRRFPFPGSGDFVGGCARDRQGRVWFSNYEDGVYRYDGGWTHIPPDSPDAIVSSLDRDHRGRIVADAWTGVVRWDGERRETIGVPVKERGTVFAIDAGPDDTLMGSERGLMRITDTATQFLSAARFPWLRQISGIARSAAGQTWFYTDDKVVRVQTADLVRAFRDPRAALPIRLFDIKDGLYGTAANRTKSDAVVGGDGRVWVATRAGVFTIDPAGLSGNKMPPPVLITSVIADGVRFAGNGAVTLPKGVRTLEIDFTGLSLSIPERNRFRYKLEGFDDDWVDPGARREAFYTNLAPGRYVFRVKAANNDGVWNETGAAVELTVPPTFFQSWPFYLLIVAGLSGLLWLAYVLRLQQVSARIRAAMQERMSERDRIARELHDTLLQGVQGMLLKLQAASGRIPARLEARAMMDATLDEAEDVLIEVRDRVGSLRAASGGDLVAAVTAISRRMDHQDGVTVSVRAEGAARAVRPLVVEEIERIVTEALFNAHRHAAASTISVEVHFLPDSLEILVRDDGRGIEPAILEKGGRAGHYGIGGMRERARRIEGTLSIRSTPGEGSEVWLTVPCDEAYSDVKPPIWRRWLRSLTGRQAGL